MHKKSIYLLLVYFAFANSGITQPSRPFPQLHYFYNSGWLVETATHLLVFDFIPHGEAGISMNTLEQKLQPAVSAKKTIIIFVTHDHNDHFEKEVLGSGRSANTHYVLGWKYDKAPTHKNTAVLLPGDSLSLTGCTVYAHTATDDGSGFLVKLNDLTIYHAGDHALWVDELLDPFKKELQNIRTKAAVIDIAFLPAARGMFTKCAYDTIIEKGLDISIDILQPRIVAPQHIGCETKLPLYTKVKEHFHNKKVSWVIPTRYNQSF
jgi:L-ascorbate metabolism protein UlaG (beta-lactamase superfamily)